MSAGVPVASVVICTFNRPLLLRRTVESCLADASPDGRAFEIVIADNSPTGHARDFAAARAAAGDPVRWVHAAPPNISVARNAGLRAASAGLVAFLDDDLVVEPGWLDRLLDTLSRTGADVAIGPVRPRFEAGTAPDWDPHGARFTRQLTLPSGTAIRAGGPERPRGFAISTASSLWRRDTCFTDPDPFDPAFGASGGEDLDLFLRLERRGRRFVWCAEAGVWETIPASRTALRYQALRAFSGGQVFAAATVRHADRPGQEAAGQVARGLAQAALRLPMLLASLAGGRPHRTGHGLALAAALGRIALWRKVPLYHIEKPPA